MARTRLHPNNNEEPDTNEDILAVINNQSQSSTSDQINHDEEASQSQQVSLTANSQTPALSQSVNSVNKLKKESQAIKKKKTYQQGLGPLQQNFTWYFIFYF
jgi:hypothetical protein